MDSCALLRPQVPLEGLLVLPASCQDCGLELLFFSISPGRRGHLLLRLPWSCCRADPHQEAALKWYSLPG